MKIFFFGGTFDPPHNGHQLIIDYSIPLCDKFIIIPTKIAPDKRNLPLANNTHRVNMLRFITNDKKIKINDYEMKSNRINYTYITVMHLKERYKDCSLHMIIGADQLLNLHKWKKYKQIMKEVNIICFNRNTKLKLLNYNLLKSKKIQFITNFNIDISSSDIRKNFYNETDYFLNRMNAKVIKYIKDNKLYA